MKKLFVAILSLGVLSTGIMASEANVFCKSGRKIYSALTEEGYFKCTESLLTDGTACFTGSRVEVITLINGDSFNWDEEWIEDAHFKGKDEISYMSVDGPNELKTKLSMKRCSADIFNK
jgi:hypothetical protein